MMHSPSIKEGSESCSFHCCLSPLLGSPRSLTQNHTANTSSKDGSGTFQYDFATATASSLYPHTQFTNHESLPQLHESFRNFTIAHPQYLNTVEADHIREHDYHHLSHFNRVCLDYFGHGLFSSSQHRRVPQEPAASSSTPLSIPMCHPGAPTLPPFFEIPYKPVTLRTQLMNGSSQETDFEASLRTRIMQFLNKSEDDYSMVFTANQSSAFKLLAESYPFETNRTLLTVYDHRNDAVEAMIESSKRRSARVFGSVFKWPKMKIHYEKLKGMIVNNRKKKGNKRGGLFVFPLQSRVTGAQYSYQWMTIAQEHGWHVLLDANALGPKDMDTLGLSLFRPDFLICTFYKVFGANPSGFSCLFVKKCHFSMLSDTAIGASRGIVNLVPPTTYTSQLSPDQLAVAPTTNMDVRQTSETARQNEDLPFVPSSSSKTFLRTAGTPSISQHNTENNNKKQKQPMLSEIEISENAGLYSMLQRDADATRNMECSEIKCKGLDHADSMGRILISTRTRYLINWLVNALLNLRHPISSETGSHLITIYGPKVRFDRASTLAFNVFDWKGERVDPILVQKLADRNNISISVEFLINICFGNGYEEEKEEVNGKILEKRLTWEGGRNNGTKKRETFDNGISVITVSIGFLNNFEDVYKFWAFVSRFLDADYVEKERWRYSALNQKTIQI